MRGGKPAAPPPPREGFLRLGRQAPPLRRPVGVVGQRDIVQFVLAGAANLPVLARRALGLSGGGDGPPRPLGLAQHGVHQPQPIHLARRPPRRARAPPLAHGTEVREAPGQGEILDQRAPVVVLALSGRHP
jgi:hypothetical protein